MPRWASLANCINDAFLEQLLGSPLLDTLYRIELSEKLHFILNPFDEEIG